VRHLKDNEGLTWDEAYKRASELLKGSDAEGTPDTMHAGYKSWEKSLPTEQRRPRTYRRRKAKATGMTKDEVNRLPWTKELRAIPGISGPPRLYGPGTWTALRFKGKICGDDDRGALVYLRGAIEPKVILSTWSAPSAGRSAPGGPRRGARRTARASGLLCTLAPGRAS
jgi:hypothetical protein